MQSLQPNYENQKLFTVKGLQDRFSLSADWVYRRARSDAAEPLPVHRLGRALRFNPQDIEQYLACHSGKAGGKLSSVSRPRERIKRMLSRRHFQTGGRPRLEGRKTKFWRGWYWQYFEDGTRKRKSVFVGYRSEFPTERSAKRKLNEIVGMMSDPECKTNSTITLGDLWKKQFELSSGFLRPSTQEDMRTAFSKHILPFLGGVSANELDRSVLQIHFSNLLRRGVSWATANKVKAYLSSVLSQAVEDGLLRSNPARLIKLGIRPAPRRPQLMTEADVVRLESSLVDERIRMLWWLTSQTGLRIGEASALRWESIDWTSGLLAVRESIRNFKLGRPKTAKSARLLYLCDEQLLRLREYRNLFPESKETDFLFPNAKGTWPVGYGNVMKRKIRPLAKKLEIAVVGWHALRHLCSTIMDEERVPLGVRKDRLGHTTANTTMIYSHGRMEEHRHASQLVYRRYAEAGASMKLRPEPLLRDGSHTPFGHNNGHNVSGPLPATR